MPCTTHLTPEHPCPRSSLTHLVLNLARHWVRPLEVQLGVMLTLRHQAPKCPEALPTQNHSNMPAWPQHNHEESTNTMSQAPVATCVAWTHLNTPIATCVARILRSAEQSTTWRTPNLCPMHFPECNALTKMPIVTSRLSPCDVLNRHVLG